MSAPVDFYELGAEEGRPSQGQLPVSEWSKADEAVRQAWILSDKLSRSVNSKTYLPGVGQSKEHFLALVENFKRRVRDWASNLERLKHGPPFNNPDAVKEWKEFGIGFEKWAKEIDSASDFSSLRGAIREVAVRSAQDVRKIVKEFPWKWVLAGGILVGGIVLIRSVADLTRAIKD